MKKVLITILIVLVLAAGVCTGLYFFTDVFNFLKPSNENFSLQAKKLFGSNEESSYSDYEEMLNNFKTSDTSYSTNANISMNLKLPSSALDSDTQDLINSSTVQVTGSYDSERQAQSAEITLNYDEDEVLTVSTITEGTTVSIDSEDLYDKTLSFDLSKIEEFCENNDVELDESDLEVIELYQETLSNLTNSNTTDLVYDLLYLTEDQYNSLGKTYGNLMIDLIDEENYTTEKNQKVTVGDDEVKTTAYSLTLSGEDAYDFLDGLIDLIQSDDNTKELLVDKIGIIMDYTETISGTSSDSSEESITTSDIDELLEEIAEELEDSKDDFTASDACIKLTIYSNKKSEPVKFEVAYLEDEDDKGSVIFTEELEEGKTTYTIDIEEINSLTGNDSSTDSYYSSSSSSTIESLMSSLEEIKIVDEYEEDDDSRKGTITISAKASGSKQDLLTIDYDTISSDSEFKFDISVSTPLLSSISLDFTYEATGLNTDTTDYKLSLSGQYSGYSVDFDMDGSITTGTSDVPELTDKNSVDVFSLSSDEFETLYNEIVTNASETLPSKLSVYGVDITKEDILDEFGIEEEVVSETEETTTETEEDALESILTNVE